MSKGVRWGGVGRDLEKVKVNRRAYVLRHPERVRARNTARNKAFAALPWDHPVRVKARERQIARYYRNKALQEGPKTTKKRSTAYKLRHKMRRFGLDGEVYVEMLVAQDGYCAICRCPERSVSKFGKRKQLAVDHDHETKKVRGLLCHGCNVGLGAFKDRPELLRTAAKYLERGAASRARV